MSDALNLSSSAKNLVTEAAAEDTVEQQRQHFPALANKLYFNYGGQGPLPQQARAAIAEAYDYVDQEGPFSGKALEWMFGQVAIARQAIARSLQVAPETITLTESVSAGCNIALWGIDWQPGDHILLSDCEHPGIIAAVQQICQRFGVVTTSLPLSATLNQGDPAEIVAAHLQPRTRLVVLSHILWNTGQVLPLKEIVQVCHEFPSRPVAVLVDAAQSVGVLPLNLGELGADFYAFTGHKWCCGPDGLGGLYIHPDAVEPLQPVFIGWRSIITDPSGFPIDWKPDGRKFEVATAAFPLCTGLTAALECHETWGTAEARYQRIQSFSHRLWQQLQALPQIHCLRQSPPQAGLISFQLRAESGELEPALLARSHQQLVKSLESQRILVRQIPAPNCVRACTHYLTLESECDRLVEAIAEFTPR
jgi:L-cysteine/cystine lyase